MDRINKPNESPVREIRDAEGRTWHVYVVVERTKWGPGPDQKRSNWLCLETRGDRRFITPVPEGWKQLSDERMRDLIAVAKPDLRGP
jgi:hypothetical protein